MNVVVLIIVAIVAHILFAIYSTLAIKDSFNLPSKQKPKFYLLSFFVPLLGGLISLAKVKSGSSSSTSSGASAAGASGIGSSDCSGSDGGGSC